MTYLAMVSKNMACFVDVLYQVLTSKKLIIFLANQSFLSKLFLELWDNKESSKENTVEVIYKVMYTGHCENTLRIEAIESINNESLD